MWPSPSCGSPPKWRGASWKLLDLGLDHDRERRLHARRCGGRRSRRWVRPGRLRCRARSSPAVPRRGATPRAAAAAATATTTARMPILRRIGAGTLRTRARSLHDDEPLQRTRIQDRRRRTPPGELAAAVQVRRRRRLRLPDQPRRLRRCSSRASGVHHAVAAVVAFCVAVTNNFLWNRHWTFGAGDGHPGFQAARFFAVSIGALLDQPGRPRGAARREPRWRPLTAQAISVAVAMPFNFLGNKLWTFAELAPAAAALPAYFSTS